MYTMANKLRQQSESSLEIWVPHHSNCNAMVCRFCMRKAEPLNALSYNVFFSLQKIRTYLRT